MNNVFVNSILAITGMAVVIALGILNLVSTPSHGMALGLVGLVSVSYTHLTLPTICSV